MKVHRFESKNKSSQPKKGRTPMDAALTYLSARARTVREVERHLDEQNYGEFEVQQVVDRLIELGYLNDEEYARSFINSRLASKPVSRRKLYEQLAARELPTDLIKEALRDIPDDQEYENALTIARKYAAQLAGLPPNEFMMRLNRRIVSRGFSYEDARRAVETVLEEVKADA